MRHVHLAHSSVGRSSSCARRVSCKNVGRSIFSPCCKGGTSLIPRPDPTAGRNLRVCFKVLYHCYFGQTVCLLGKGPKLGDWDVESALKMKWSTGDLWCVDVEWAADRPLMEFEYKYLIKNNDGTVYRWKSGSNYLLAVQRFEPNGIVVTEVKIIDSWDGSVRELDMVKVNPQAGKTSVSNEDVEHLKLMSSMEAALLDLQAAIVQAEQLKKTIADPAAPQMLEMDRKMAHLQNTVVALSRALGQGQQAGRSKQLPEKNGVSPGLMNGTSPLQRAR